MREITVSEMHESETVKIVESYRSKKVRLPPQIRAYVTEKGTNKILKREPKQSLKTIPFQKNEKIWKLRPGILWIWRPIAESFSNVCVYTYNHKYICICIYIYLNIYICIIINTYVYLSTKLYKYIYSTCCEVPGWTSISCIFLSTWQFVSLFSLFLKKGVYIRLCKFREKTSELRTGSRTSSFLRYWETYCARRSVLPSFEEDQCNTTLNTTF